MNKIEDVIIIGGGKSISEGLELGLKDHIHGKCVILINYAYKFIDGTFLVYLDDGFYKTQKLEYNPDIYNELASLPLIISVKNKPNLKLKLHPNTYLIDMHPPEGADKSFALTGQFAIKLAEKLSPKKIFLLGFDWSRSPVPEDKSKYTGETDIDIHFYGQGVKHRGIGRTKYYDGHNPGEIFKLYGRSCKIYNVSPNSEIPNFEKIDYPTMFALLNNVRYNQDELRKHIKSLIIEK